MMIDLSPGWLVAADVFGWLAVQLTVAWAGTQCAARFFQPDGGWFKTRSWEQGGIIYERVFRVKQWKDSLPDGAALFRGGFRKRAILSHRPDYLRRFVIETCRGEAVHAVAMLFTPLFFLWNPPGVWWGMIVYALAANGPCLIAQRYNRIRIQGALKRRDSSGFA
jgi:glycosyl-4,4'-diaponeurosporenoate acyltransferase